MTAEEQELLTKIQALTVKDFGSWTADNAKALFARYSTNGYATKDQLTQLLSDANIGNFITRGAWASGVMDKVDTNKDGFISLDEFMKVIAPTLPATPAPVAPVAPVPSTPAPSPLLAPGTLSAGLSNAPLGNPDVGATTSAPTDASSAPAAAPVDTSSQASLVPLVVLALVVGGLWVRSAGQRTL